MVAPIAQPRVAILVGSSSDWGVMVEAAKTLKEFGVAYEARVLSAHRTPEALRDYVLGARDRGLKLLIAAAGGAAHLPGVVAAQTVLPVLGVAIESGAFRGVDALLAMVPMPAGVPVGCVGVGRAGARNAALLAVAILGVEDPKLWEALEIFRKEQSKRVLGQDLELP
ncbi:5-(carboxyamino)imidazole ribonucleotide mutase [Candidatus Methylacidithermus pantelleriae]|uniref:5-(carboxyamino)imidazole ribonucleotide mutase n=1 Tax=Candidatus Methylacidithermus pantelleriae TaxID=2744239 RepID=UPI001F387A1F|nr:5-(carboxyamino)imidazole ribonucleotide mutase [Candidatus Methylacidithermus pantelleriae]